jgi:uncharacterized protein with gpF-like domain
MTFFQSGLVDDPGWRLKAEEEFGNMVVRILRRVVFNAFERFTGFTASSGDPSSFDQMATEWDTAVAAEIAPALDEVFKVSAAMAWNAAPTTRTLSRTVANNWVDAIQADALEVSAARYVRLQGVGAGIRSAVTSLVTSAVDTGAGTEALKLEIERLTNFSEFRADTIARTELNAAFTSGAYRAQVALGPYGPTMKEWRAVRSPRSRPSHLALSGSVVPFDARFTVDGGALLYPLDPSGSAKTNANCRCDVVYYYPGEQLPTGDLAPS